MLLWIMQGGRKKAWISFKNKLRFAPYLKYWRIIMEISYPIREIMYYGIVLFFIGYIVYNFAVSDKEISVKKLP